MLSCRVLRTQEIAFVDFVSLTSYSQKSTFKTKLIKLNYLTHSSKLLIVLSDSAGKAHFEGGYG